MLKRLLKLLSGLTVFWAGKPRGPCPGTWKTCSISQFELVSNPKIWVSDIQDRRFQRQRADYRTCDTCDTFLPRDSSSKVTCRECAKRRVRFGARPARASVAVGGVELSLPLDCHVAPSGQAPRTMVKLGYGQAEALSRIMLKPGSDGMGIGFDGNDSMLTAGWVLNGHRMAELVVCRSGEPDSTLTLSAAQAARLGEDIVACLGIIFTDAPACDHEFVDARNEHVASGELCVRCGAIRAGDGDGGQGVIDTPDAFLEFIRKGFDRSKLRPREVETLSSYLGFLNAPAASLKCRPGGRDG